MDKLLKLNLQFFAEGEGGGDSEGQSNQGGITQKGNTFDYTDPSEVPEYQGGLEPFPWEHEPSPNLSNELDNMTEQQPDQQQQQPEQSSQESTQSEQTEPSNEPSEFDFGGRKVKPNDPESIKGAYEDFQNSQRTITQLQQQVSQYENLLNNLHQMGINPNNPNQQQGQPSLNANERFNNQQPNFQQPNMQQNQQQFQMPSQERMQELHNQYMDKQYENKFEADLWWEQQPEVQAWRAQQTQQFVNPMLEPIQRERETQQRLQDMQSKYNDFDQYVPKMQEILDQRPDLNSVENIENVYWIAKAQALESQPTLEDRLKDPEFRKQLANDESFRNEVLSSYQSQKQQTNRQAPPMIGAKPGGKTPTYQYRAPRSIREAGKMVRKNIRFH